MRTGLLILAGAALMLPAVPANAQRTATSWTSDSGGAGVRVHRGWDGPRHGADKDWHNRDGRWRDHDGRPDGRWRGRNGSDVIVYDNGLWALYNNRSWEADSFNDWFHEREDRSVPRWVQNNQDCKRVYWSGGGWTC